MYKCSYKKSGEKSSPSDPCISWGIKSLFDTVVMETFLSIILQNFPIR